ncbi:hypothetical protein RND71_035460 [Anisodus tanguticus]|uniref:Uncharacterized protein n=1 Tax=Anisodus tanguticus TaxID=243964 RepID=A0AAE1R4B4_9SOLA|nr:hypothetical protein RND71_035460 [Anisodus tanguticus]
MAELKIKLERDKECGLVLSQVDIHNKIENLKDCFWNVEMWGRKHHWTSRGRGRGSGRGSGRSSTTGNNISNIPRWLGSMMWGTVTVVERDRCSDLVVGIWLQGVGGYGNDIEDGMVTGGENVVVGRLSMGMANCGDCDREAAGTTGLPEFKGEHDLEIVDHRCRITFVTTP